ncbi:MAG: recombination protein RecO, partial [Campylobacterota bacterium]|nr:recombination protein RecO [Campylobacterota bacterium]
LGFKIDYEKESSLKSTISRLKDVVHIGFPWINDYKLLKLWQDFLSLFFKHLKDSEKLNPFYFDLIQTASINWSKQNPKRVAVESYVKLLKYEGRLHLEHRCFLCSEMIKEDISLIRAYLPTHYRCTKTLPIDREALDKLLRYHSTLFLSDKEVDRLWDILMEGL